MNIASNSKSINISHVVSDISVQSGGLSTYIKSIIEALDGKLVQYLNCINYADNIPINAEVEISFYENNKLSNWFTKSPVLKNRDIDVLHGNGLWQYPVHKMARIARKSNVPYIISPHGMLEPWALEKDKLKKLIGLKLYQFKDLKNATCLHATAPMEANSIRAIGLKNPIAIIPNGVEIIDFPVKKFIANSGKRKVLFLSRIHPKKGIEILIDAWSQLPASITQNWCVDIIGNGHADYIEKLNLMISDKGLSDSIVLKSPIFGQKKIDAYHNAKIFVLPTYSENFGIVVAEALACGTPVITTKGAPWKDLEINECGWWIDIGVNPLKVALEEALSVSDSKLEIMGKNGRQLIENKYSMQAVAEQMLELYKWLLNKGKQPHFIQMD